MAIFKIQCEIFIEAENVEAASFDVFDVVNHAVNNYDGWMAGSIDKAELYEGYNDE